MTPTSVASESAVDRPTQRESRWLIALVFIAIAIRIILMMFRGADLKTDPDGYVAHAETLLKMGNYCVPGTERPTAFRPPLYPIVLAGLRLVGLKANVAVALVNLAASAWLISATWWMARLVGLRGLWSHLAAAAVGLDPLLLRYSVLPMTETLSAALLAIGLLKTLRLWKAQACTGQLVESPLRSAIVAGMCFGFGGLCRPVILISCAVVSIVTLIRALSLGALADRHSSRRQMIGLSFVPALVAATILAPWIVRNAIVFERFIPATTHGGYTLLLGNNPVFYKEVVRQPGQPAWQRESLDKWQQQLIAEMTAAGVDREREPETDRWQYERAIKNIEADQSGFHQSIVLRWKRFWALRSSIEQSGGSQVFSVLSAVWYMVIFAGLLLSLLLCVIRRAADIHLLWWSILSFLLLHSFYWTNTRMRAPLVAAIVVLSAFGWHFLYQQSRKFSRGPSTLN